MSLLSKFIIMTFTLFLYIFRSTFFLSNNNTIFSQVRLCFHNRDTIFYIYNNYNNNNNNFIILKFFYNNNNNLNIIMKSFYNN